MGTSVVAQRLGGCRRAGLTAGVLLGLTCLVPTRAQESEGFIMRRVTLTATGAVASSATFDTTVTFGQAVPVGAVSRCNGGYHQSAGFWSLVGDLPVPTVLQVNLDPDDEDGVVLNWSGSAPQFRIYRAGLALSVLDDENQIQMVSECSTSDASAAEPILYYNVIPAGP